MSRFKSKHVKDFEKEFTLGTFADIMDKEMRRRTAYLLFIFLAFSIVAGGKALRIMLETLPSPQTLEEYIPQLTTRLYDFKGLPISEFFTQRRVWVPLKDIPVDLQNAIIAIEDHKFFKHWGVSPKGMFRAAVKNFVAGRVVQGGSTITQQLSKVIFLTHKKTFTRKFKELLLALQIENRFSKEEILQMYLNQVYFGKGAYGVSAAAKTYFGKTVQELELPESALLAGLPRLPNYYSPFRNPTRAFYRRSTVLNRMHDLGYITEAENKHAKSTPVSSEKVVVSSRIAPYFVEYVRQSLEAEYGSDMLYRGGLAIYTTIDLKMQTIAEEVVLEALNSFDEKYGEKAEIIRAKYKTEALRETGDVPKDFVVEPSTTIPKIQGALVALDPKTGAIRAMVGGRNFRESQFNRATQAKRQPGSAFKPFVWISALDGDFTPATIIEDSPLSFYNDGHDWRIIEGGTNSYTVVGDTDVYLMLGGTDLYRVEDSTSALPEDQVWIPKNYDNKYLGNVTLRRGLTSSRNLVAIRLIDHVKPRTAVEWAKKMGIKSRLAPVLSLALGTSVLTPLELTNAFATIAAEGIRTKPYSIEKIIDFEGKVIEQNFPQETEVIAPDLNFLITNLMRGVIREGTGRAARLVGRPAAGKTGTSQDQRDLWFTGFTPDLVTVAWMGYDDFSPLGKRISSGGIVAPWWAKFMKRALEDVPVKDFTVPAGITFAKIDRTTGFLSLPSCPRVILEAFKSGTEPTEFCEVDHAEQFKVQD